MIARINSKTLTQARALPVLTLKVSVGSMEALDASAPGAPPCASHPLGWSTRRHSCEHDVSKHCPLRGIAPGWFLQCSLGLLLALKRE